LDKIKRAKEVIDGYAVKKVRKKSDCQREFLDDEGEFRDIWNYRPGADRWSEVGRTDTPPSKRTM
jgi:hypothetical protein